MSQDLVRARRGVAYDRPTRRSRDALAARRHLIDRVSQHPQGIHLSDLSRTAESLFEPAVVREQYWHLMGDYEILRDPDGTVRFTVMGRQKHLGE